MITRYKVQKTEAEKLEYRKRREKDKSDKKDKRYTPKKCGECVNCLRKHDCGECPGCTDIYRQKCIYRICENRGRTKSNEVVSIDHQKKIFDIAKILLKIFFFFNRGSKNIGNKDQS